MVPFLSVWVCGTISVALTVCQGLQNLEIVYIFLLESPESSGAELPGKSPQREEAYASEWLNEHWSQCRLWVVIGKPCSQNEGGPFLLVGTKYPTDTHCRWKKKRGHSWEQMS